MSPGRRLGLLIFAVLVPLLASAQTEYITATAVGQSINLGKNFQIQISIRDYSTPEETQILRDALKTNGSEGLSNALKRMKSHGNVSMPRTTGYELSYVRVYETPNGRMIRMVTNRKLGPGEAWTDAPSMEYTLGAFEININNNGKHTGIVYPSAKISLTPEGKIKIEPYGYPWTLVNIDDRK